jgi:hypothetical protein
MLIVDVSEFKLPDEAKLNTLPNVDNRLTPVTTEVVGSIPGQIHCSCDREGDYL